MLTPMDLQTFLDTHAIPGQLLFLSEPTPTVEIAARVVGASPDQIAKSILFFADAQPVLAIACGAARIDRRVIAALYGVGRKRVTLASPAEVLDTAGYEVGAMPPFGHLTPLPTLADLALLRLAEADQPIYAGGGGENVLLRLHPRDLLRVAAARPVDLLLPVEERP